MRDKKNIPMAWKALIDKLEEKTQSSYNGLLGTINQGMSTLFYNIGTTINEKCKDYSIVEKEIIKGEISKNLTPIFGSYLNDQNLCFMTTFARKCNSDVIRYASSILNIEYLPYFLDLEEENAWKFYAELIYTESLMPLDLAFRISANAYEKSNGKLNDNKNSFFLPNSNSLYNHTFQLYFGNKSQDSFCDLFKPQHNEAFFDTPIKEIKNYDILIDIYKKILIFQSVVHHELNMQFNSLHWNIGIEIIHLSKFSNIPIPDDLLKYCVLILNTKFPSIFNRNELDCCIRFVEMYGTDALLPIDVAQTLSWPYIKLLLEVDDIEKHLYIADHTLKNGLSIQEMQKIISSGFPSFDLNRKLLQKSTSKNLISVTTTKTKNFVVRGTMKTIEPIFDAKYDLNRNIYKNPELLSFLTSSMN